MKHLSLRYATRAAYFTNASSRLLYNCKTFDVPRKTSSVFRPVKTHKVVNNNKLKISFQSEFLIFIFIYYKFLIFNF